MGYGVQHRRDGAAWASEVPAGRDTSGTGTTHTVTGLTNGVTYHLRVTPCNQAKGCLPWSDQVGSSHASVSGTPTAGAPGPGPGNPGPPSPPQAIAGCGSIAPGALAIPTELNIIPYSQRRALLTWVGSEAATHYAVQISQVGSSDTKTFTVARNPCRQIALDDILEAKEDESPRSLANSDAFQIEVKAQVIASDSTTVLRSSDPSETVTLVDNPIVSINGNSKNVTGEKGKAVVRWPRVTGATAYTLIYRELPPSHWLPSWGLAPPTASRPRKSINVGDNSATQDPSDSSMLLYTIGGASSRYPLERFRIYAVSMNFIKGSDRYFAAREAYVWPSDRPADGSERVGTFPLVHRLKDKTYSYRFCGETFIPEGTRRDDWLRLTHAALEQWMTATKGFITVRRDTAPCENYDVVVSQIQQNIEDYLQDEDLQETPFEDYVKSFMDGLRANGTVRGSNSLSKTQNEVYMFDDLSGTNLLFYQESIFDEIASDIGYECWGNIVAKGKDILEGRRARVGVMCAQSEDDTEHFTDIVVRRSAYDRNIDIVPWGSRATNDPLLIPSGTVRFNTCRSSIRQGTAYEDMLHEGGHALGIGADRPNNWIQESHPQVPDSVMNYDFIAVRIHPHIPPQHEDDFDAGFREPDCAPHPLDLMAIYALYQTD